jgi:hypothetical protein
MLGGGPGGDPCSRVMPQGPRRRTRRSRHRGARPHQALWRLHRRRRHQLADSARRDFRAARTQRRRQIDNFQDAVRAPQAQQPEGRVRASTSPRSRARPQSPRLHGAKFSLYGDLNVTSEPRILRRRLRFERRAQTRRIASWSKYSTSAGIPAMSSQRSAARVQAAPGAGLRVMHEPEVLFLDEPTSGVDPITRREFWTHINALVEKGVPSSSPRTSWTKPNTATASRWSIAAS